MPPAAKKLPFVPANRPAALPRMSPEMCTDGKVIGGMLTTPPLTLGRTMGRPLISGRVIVPPLISGRVIVPPLIVGRMIGPAPVSYTHLTLPTNREV